MNCDKCGKPLGEEDEIADVNIDLSRNERYNFVWCRNCTVDIAEECERQMADIYSVTGKVVSTNEPFNIRVEWEQSAELLAKALQETNEFEDVKHEQRY